MSASYLVGELRGGPRYPTLRTAFNVSGALAAAQLEIVRSSPSIAQFGVTGVLARPQLTINSGAAVLASLSEGEVESAH